MKILVLGINGFIGANLTSAILRKTDWELYGMDMESHRLGTAVEHPHFHFREGDITISKEWVEYHIKKCDVCLPLVAIATPAVYITDPLRVFRLDFEANLRIVKLCAKHRTRVVFPSTSEVYGMCQDELFNPETSNLVLGPISKERWIYACSKQLLDRVIWAMGHHEHLPFTLFRPFNWVGPGLDSISTEKIGSSRVVTQFLGQILRKEPLQLVDGGSQRRSFTDIRDGIDALMRLIANRNGSADRGIFNVGHPGNDFSVRELAEKLLTITAEMGHDLRRALPEPIQEVTSQEYYGNAYQDMIKRRPWIDNTRDQLDWNPRVGMDELLRNAATFFIKEFNTREMSVYDYYLEHPEFLK